MITQLTLPVVAEEDPVTAASAAVDEYLRRLRLVRSELTRIDRDLRAHRSEIRKIIVELRSLEEAIAIPF